MTHESEERVDPTRKECPYIALACNGVLVKQIDLEGDDRAIRVPTIPDSQRLTAPFEQANIDGGAQAKRLTQLRCERQQASQPGISRLADKILILRRNVEPVRFGRIAGQIIVRNFTHQANLAAVVWRIPYFDFS
jgi:hypothetical protein